MSNFAGDKDTTTYTEPEGSLIYRSKIDLGSDWDEDDDRVGLFMGVHGGGHSVFVGVGGEADVQQFLYEAAVRSKLIKDGDPLILMKSVTADEDAV